MDARLLVEYDWCCPEEYGMESDGFSSRSGDDPTPLVLSPRGVDTDDDPRFVAWCDHETLTRSSFGTVCVDCGEVVEDLDYSSDHNGGGNRCQHRPVPGRSVDDVFIRNNIHEQSFVLDEVDRLYKTIVKKDKVRSARRDSLVAICYRFYLLKNGEYIPVCDLKSMFGVPKKYLPAALTRYYLAFPQDRTIYLYPHHLVKRCIRLHQAYHHKVANPTLGKPRLDSRSGFCGCYRDGTLLSPNPNTDCGWESLERCINPIEKMCQLSQNRSKKLNRSTPQAIASAMVYIYFMRHNPGWLINKKTFALNMGLSDITVDKIVKEIHKLFEL
jgi:hypothetical protein